MVKCPYCQEKLSKDDAITKGRQYYHENCLKEKERNSEHYKELIGYICTLYGLDTPTGMILKQIKDFQEQYGYKLKGMTLALKYFHETLGNPVRDGDGIGIIPFVYEEAKKYYLLKIEVEKSASNIEAQKNTRVYEIYSPKFEYKKNTNIIDISAL